MIKGLANVVGIHDVRPGEVVYVHMPKKAWTYGPEVILGQLGSKSNSRKVVKFGKGAGARTAVIKGDVARAWWRDALRQIARPLKPFAGDVRLVVTCYYADRRRDLDVALLQDLLQVGSPKNPGVGIILNDRQVVEIHAWRKISKERPRVVFSLEEIVESVSTLLNSPAGGFVDTK